MQDISDNDSLYKGAYIKGNLECLPFSNKSFDIVTCYHTLEHLKDLPTAISELKRVALNK